MYNIMVVDDDQLVRERICAYIPLESLNLHLCGVAEDGVQALELFEQTRPQIVIMDINIPLINGIDVAKRMLQEDPDVNVIIVTGYGTVDFAKEAIREGMIDFLLKPINGGELKLVLSKTVKKLKEKSQRAMEQQRMERLLERGMPLLRNKYFLTLLQTSPELLSEDSCRQYLADFGIDKVPGEICVAIVVSQSSKVAINKQMSLQAILEEELTNLLQNAGIGCIVVYDFMQRAIVIAYGSDPHLSFALENRISIIRDKMRYIYQMDLVASIGSTVTGFAQLSLSYQDAERALSYCNILGENNIVSSGNLTQIKLQMPQLPCMAYGDIMELLISANLETIQTALNEYFNNLVYTARISVHSMQMKAIEVVSLFLACSRALNENTESILEDKPSVYVRILSSNSVNSIVALVQETVQRIVDIICGRREENKNRALSGAKRYIMQNFSDPSLNLARVAEAVNLSPSYVSLLFKRQEDSTFTEYLNAVRVEQAKKLLSTTHMRVYEVAEAVGYQNSKYFFQVFKQITGKRPREFYTTVGTD